MHGTRRAAAAVGLGLLGASAAAHGISDRIDAVEEAVDAAIAGTTDADALRALGKMAKALDKLSNETSIANEVKSVSKSAKVLEDSLGGSDVEQALVSAHDNARIAYQSDLAAALSALDAALAADSLPASARTKIQRARDAVDAALAPLRAAPIDLGTLSGKLAQIAKGLKAAKGFTVYDDGSQSRYVVSELLDVAPADSIDLDGDGDGDNAIRALGALASFDVAAISNDSLRTSPTLPLLWIWGVNSLKSDPVAFAGLGAAEDQDMDTSDNFSGEEPFRLTSSVAGDGRPVPRAWTRISASKFRFELSGTEIDIGGFVVPAEGFVVVDGTLTPGATVPVEGRIGMALPLAAVEDGLEAAGITLNPFIQLALQSSADLDLDGNGSKDGLSLCLRFRAVTTGDIETER